MAQEKPLIWMGSSKRDLKEMSEDVQDSIGFVLGLVQEGKHHAAIKPLTGKEFAGVHEIRANVDKDTYRAVYVLNLGEHIFMLHVFQKKSKKGISTPKQDMDIIRNRLKQAKALAKELDHE